MLCWLTQKKNNRVLSNLSHPAEVLKTDFVSIGSFLWIITPLSQHVKLGGKVSRVKVPQMLCPHKLQPAGLEEVRPGFMWVLNKRLFMKHYVRHLRCSCLITVESITYPEKSRPSPAGHGWQRINRDPHFQMCVCSSIVRALYGCTLLVAVYLIVSNVLEIIDVSAQLHLLCSVCVCVAVRACERVSSWVQQWFLLTRQSPDKTTPEKHTKPNIYFIWAKSLKTRDYLQHWETAIMFSQLHKKRPHEIRSSKPLKG